MQEEGVILSGNVYKSPHVASDTLETRSALCITQLTSDQKGSRKFCCDYLHIRLEDDVGTATGQNR